MSKIIANLINLFKADNLSSHLISFSHRTNIMIETADIMMIEML